MLPEAMQYYRQGAKGLARGVMCLADTDNWQRAVMMKPLSQETYMQEPSSMLVQCSGVAGLPSFMAVGI